MQRTKLKDNILYTKMLTFDSIKTMSKKDIFEGFSMNTTEIKDTKHIGFSISKNFKKVVFKKLKLQEEIINRVDDISEKHLLKTQEITIVLLILWRIYSAYISNGADPNDRDADFAFGPQKKKF